MSDLESQLRRQLADLPEPPSDSRQRIRTTALEALPDAAPGPRSRRALTLTAAVAALAVLAGVGLAASDRLSVRIGAPSSVPAVVPAEEADGALALPEGGRGIAVIAAGRLWATTRGGFEIRGLAVSAAEISPNATFLAAGIGDSLAALAPDGRRAWSHPAGGDVVAISWAPNPIVLAYIVRRPERHELWIIEGDGDRPRLVDRDVAPVRPSWRADSGRLAYAGRDGTLRIVAHPALARVEAPDLAAAAIAYAPSGGCLAIAAHGVVRELCARARIALTLPNAGSLGVAWSGESLLVSAPDAPGGSGAWAIAGGGKPDPVATPEAGRRAGLLADAGTAEGQIALVPGPEGTALWHLRDSRGPRLLGRVPAIDSGVRLVAR